MSNPVQRLALFAFLTFSVLSSSGVKADTIRFMCSWDENRPIEIIVDTDAMRAVRNDGGAGYMAIKISKWAVWLVVDEPNNVVGANIQVIERAAGMDDPSKGGAWHDVSVTPRSTMGLVGGVCWEDQ